MKLMEVRAIKLNLLIQSDSTAILNICIHIRIQIAILLDLMKKPYNLKATENDLRDFFIVSFQLFSVFLVYLRN